MTVQTTCPACGAPLKYAGEQDVVVCGFCSTEIKVVSEGEDVGFQVLSQPEPQKEVLANPYNPIIENEPAAGAPVDVAPESFNMETSDQEPFFVPAPVSPAPYQGSLGDTGAQVFPANPPGRTALGGLPKWALIIIAVLAALCVLCLCAGAASILIVRSTTGSL